MPKFSYLKEINSQAVQEVTDRIDRAYDKFFLNLKRNKSCSPPKFKKVNKYKSFTLKQSGWKVYENTRTVTINGQNYRYCRSKNKKKPRNIVGKIKTVTIKHDKLRDIYIFIVTDAQDTEGITRTGKRVGYDFGLKVFLTASDGKDIISPLFFAQNSTLIKKACKKLSKKENCSKNREKARVELARLHKKHLISVTTSISNWRVVYAKNMKKSA